MQMPAIISAVVLCKGAILRIEFLTVSAKISPVAMYAHPNRLVMRETHRKDTNISNGGLDEIQASDVQP